jgi:hypothetical protein
VPVKRRAAKARIEGVSPLAFAMLTDAPLPTDGNPFEHFCLDEYSDALVFCERPTLRGLWEAHRTELLAAWADERPGTRPAVWWRWDAPRCSAPGRRVSIGPELRRRLGGIGDVFPPRVTSPGESDWGIPTQWVTADQIGRYNGRSLKGPRDCWTKDWTEGHFPYAAPDPADPPLFEAQASYLQRHGLLLPGEAERVTAEDFAPERIDVAEADAHV